MPQTTEVKIVMDRTLVEHFAKGLQEHNSSNSVGEEITNLLQIVLEDSEYPITAKITGKNEIQLAYRLRSFSQPIF